MQIDLIWAGSKKYSPNRLDIRRREDRYLGVSHLSKKALQGIMESQQITAMIYRLQVKRPIELLRALFDFFHSDEALISLEGDLSFCDARGIQVILREPTSVASLNTNSKKEKVVLILDSAGRENFSRNIVPRAGINSRIHRILLTVSDHLVFASYDNFDKDCVWVTAEVGEEWLNNLIAAKIIRSFELAILSKSEVS